LKKIHLIAVGGAIMHNLAIALKNRGYKITGSDDAIYDPAKSNLEKADLLPAVGWDTDYITSDIDVVILGMHARADNPELQRARELGLKIMSFPEFVADECEDKKRIVVAGSHGKTTTTAMIMHVLSQLQMDFDYLVGSSIDGFDLSVKLTDADLIIIEGDEYLSSPLDMKSKFLWYQPHLSIITGIAYDHINVFPTFESYLATFRSYIASHHKDGKFFWFQKDEHLAKMVTHTSVLNKAYDTPQFRLQDGGTIVTANGVDYPLAVVGKHNLENLQAAQLVCQELDISLDAFYKAAESFTGAGRRMEKIIETETQVVYRDFAHSPSKLQATTEAIAETYTGNTLAVFELHTFSSLNKDFLPLYKDTMSSATKAVVYFDEEVFAHKKMIPMSPEFVKECFGNVTVLNSASELSDLVNVAYDKGDNILLMSSGKFNNADFKFI
jgi:UDP-N-acetylmuramate: L-alanyl-gamma-D-glutamyl-meso-diaminopimelate ligase|tara:strand:- start:965 stop:2287 length:1323 start_codon:yes stop_codon:yes gene_type:complete